MASRDILATPSESWDDDFVFQRAKNRPNTRNSDPLSASKGWPTDTLHTRPSASSLSQLDGQPPIARLKEWAEPGPSTPPKHSIAQTENWDDDFEDKTDSPARQPASRPHHKRPKLPEIPEPENWDDDIDAGKFVSPKKDPTWDSSDEEDGPDFADQEEDKTVTAHPRKVALSKSSPPPPLPQLPLFPASQGETFPGSPTMSVFSVPSGRDSATYSSAAHLPLRGGASLTMLPPSPPSQKGRRRLRKKSRPPDNNVFELLDREQDSTPLPSPPQPTTPNPAPADLPPSDPSNNNPRSSILSRIGSVKRWGARKRRTSPGPGDATAADDEPGRDATPRAAASQSQTPSRTPSWFFRSSETPESNPGSPLGSATLELKHERSFRRLKAFVPVDSPTKAKQSRILGSMLGERSHDPGSASTLEGSPPASPRRPRRPKSMQVPTRVASQFPRQASYGARSISRSTSHTSTEDLGRENEGKGKEREKEKEDGHRGFMNGVRRISLVPGKRHKRTKSSSSTAIEDINEPSLPAVPQILSPSTLTVTPSIAAQLLPPIELQPPSPPRVQPADEPRRSIASERSIISTSESLAAGLESLLLQPAVDAKSPTSSSSITPKPSPTKGPGSPQSASLGRATQPPPTSTATGIVPRRNSLGDLKIPARISQAQVGLKRDLGMVREFATEVERLKELQSVYQTLTVEAQAVLLEPPRNPSAPRTTSPTFFPLPRPRSRARSNTSPSPFVENADSRKQFAASFYHLDHKYKVSWECAELLIELGGGPPAPPSQPSSSTLPSAQQLTHPGESINGPRNRERAITLAGDESAPPLPMSIAGPSTTTSPPGEWRGSTGRNDLSQRQLWLLRDMLNKSDASPTMLASLQTLEEIPVNRSFLWGDATSSTITLPSEESGRNAEPTKKRRYSRLGMSGLRDMLRSLTRGHHPPPVPPLPFRPASSASTSASSSYDDHSTHGQDQQHRVAKSSTGPDTTPSVRTSSPFGTAPALTLKSPRRPSIASIFRFAQKGKPSPPAAEPHSRPREHSHPPHPHARILHSYSSGSDLTSRSGTLDGDDDDEEEDEDWDHIDAAEDLDAAARVLGLPTRELNGAATVRGRRTKLQKHHQHPHRREAETEHTLKASPATRITALASTSQSSLSLWADSPSTASRSQVSLAATASPPSTSSPRTPPLPLPLSQATSYLRPTRLSNVEETAEAQLDGEQSQSSNHALHAQLHVSANGSTRTIDGKSKSPHRTTMALSAAAASSTRRGSTLNGSVRSVLPPTPTLPPRDGGSGVDRRSVALSLTPETIRPLLENARKVHALCTECVGELRALLASRP
ncbi:hypothetical protein H4582DRAFT_2059614 [Lactarius indigo]|nr:hypothetical protein H4582DRAFT_2059614 [Lactarius indigo]